MRNIFLKPIKPLIPQILGVRRLHLFPSPRPEIVIGSNAAVFATLASLQKHPKGAHPNLTIICRHSGLIQFIPVIKILIGGKLY